MDLFLDAHRSAPRQIILDLDATDVPLHGHQEGRFFHGYYDCHCYLPLYVFCGRHLLAAKLRRANIDASAGAVDEVERIVGRVRARWPRVRILLRADSGFAREAMMAWCEANRVDFVFGLARNARLVEELAIDLAWAEEEAGQDRPAGAALQGLPLVDARQLVAPAARRRQGRVDPRRGRTRASSSPRSSPAEIDARTLYERDLLRPRRDGEPHQGVPARPVRRPGLGRHHAGQPAAAVVRLHGLCPALRAAPHRPRAYPVRRGHLRHACASRCSGSAPRSADRSGASSSPWPRRIPSRTSSPWPTPGSRLSCRPDDPDTASRQRPAKPFAERRRRSTANLRRAPPSGRRSPRKGRPQPHGQHHSITPGEKFGLAMLQLGCCGPDPGWRGVQPMSASLGSGVITNAR